MRRVLLLAVLLLAPLAALAEDGTTRLPFTPFSNVKEGDYAVFSIASETLTLRVIAVASGSVTVERNGKNEVVSTAQAPTVASYFGRWEKSRISAWRVRDDTLELGGLRVPCQRLTFVVRTKEEHANVALWFSTDVKGSGVVQMRIRRDEPTPRVEEHLLAEFGTSQGSRWKKTTEGEKR